MDYKRFLTKCAGCGKTTSRSYALQHDGLCKPCVTGTYRPTDAERREQIIIDHGYDAYAREEGHYDLPDYA